MARFRFDERADCLVADDHGDIEYAEAIAYCIDDTIASIEEALWNLVDEIEYMVDEESKQPTNVGDDCADDEAE